MNFYKRHIGDYLKDTAHLSLLEHGIYARLMDVYYTRESGIPDGQAARLIGARTKEETQALRAVLGEFFELADGIWVQARCEREIEAAATQANANRDNGKKGGRPKGSKNRGGSERKPDSPSFGSVVETEQKPSGFSLGSVLETEKNLSQTPDTISQKDKSGIGTSNVVDPVDNSGVPPPFPRASELAILMRKHGASVTPANPHFMAWAERDVTDEQALDALAIAKRRRADAGSQQPINAGFLDSILCGEVLAAASKPAKPSRHHGIAETDFREGVSDDGRF